MSVILDALQRARKDGATNADSMYTAATGPGTVSVRATGKYGKLLITFIITSLVVMVLLCGLALWFIVSKFNVGLAPGQVLRSSSPAAMSDKPREVGSHDYGAFTDVPPLNSPGEHGAYSVAQGNQNNGASLPVDNPTGNAGVVPPRSLDPASALSASAELPPPVPISELKADSSSVSSLPPPPGARAGSLGGEGIKLGTILCEANLCIAVINGRGMREGQTVKGYKILQITPTEVTVQRGTDSPIMLVPGTD